MKEIGTIYADYTFYPADKALPPRPTLKQEVRIRVWEHGDPFPDLGESVGVDTETEKFTETKHDPPVVVTGVFDPKHSVCWIVYWYDTTEFMTELNRRDIQQRYFNLGYDEPVLDNEDDAQTLIDAIEAGRVRDMQIRTHLYDVATYGVILRSRKCNHYSLEGCTLDYFHIQLDKGHDKGDEAARLSFRRLNDDGTRYEITNEQAVYLTYDCMSTWAIGDVIPEQPTEVTHTKGMVVLAHISNNGLQVDERVFNYIVNQLMAEKEKFRLQLLDFGFPDPDKVKESPIEAETAEFDAQYSKLVESYPDMTHWDEDGLPPLNKARLKLMLIFMYNFSDGPEELNDLVQTVIMARECDDKKTRLRKDHERLLAQLLEEHNLDGILGATKQVVMVAFMAQMLKQLNEQTLTNGFDFTYAVNQAEDYVDAHPEWLRAAKDQKGPQVFLQEHFMDLMQHNPKLILERTEKSKQIKLSLKDHWRLEDAGVEDPFLEAYTQYKHCQKYLSTYLNREYVRADSRIHAHFTNILRTGRTSCSAPNIQNLPSRDKKYPLKNMFCPYDGMLLCATDFSFVELCAFAQSCYTRFGFSVMRDVINAGLDPHRWFAGVMDQIITPDLSQKDDPEWVKQMQAFLKKNVSDELRQKAKAANFGFPGALGVKTFYRNCRESGIVLTMDDAAFMHDAWIDTFKEMKYHMNPERMTDDKFSKRFYANWNDDEDEIEIDPEERNRMMYRAELPCGQVRSYCTFNAA